jgi:hypothetical protein
MKHLDEARHVEDPNHRETPHKHNTFVFAPLSNEDEVIQASNPPAHEEENVVSCTPLQIFDIVLFHDSESEEVLEEPLDALDGDQSCYNKDDDVIENIDDLIHVGRYKWDIICSGLKGDPIYDIEGHFQLLPLEQPYVIATDSDAWKHEDDMITDLFQPPRDDLLQHSYDDFWSYPGGSNNYSFEHLDLFYKKKFQPPLCSDFDEGKNMIFLEQDFCDESFLPSPLSPCYFSIDMVGGVRI